MENGKSIAASFHPYPHLSSITFVITFGQWCDFSWPRGPSRIMCGWHRKRYRQIYVIICLCFVKKSEQYCSTVVCLLFLFLFRKLYINLLILMFVDIILLFFCNRHSIHGIYSICSFTSDTSIIISASHVWWQ